MNKFYTPNPLNNLLSKSPKILFPEDEVLKNDKDFLLLMSLNLISDEDDAEPNDALIDFLFNYSKSIDVVHLKTNKNTCVFNKN